MTVLSLAYHISQSVHKEKQVAIVDRDLKVENERLFHFLYEESSPLDHLALFSSVPTVPFLQAVKNTGLRPGR